MTINSAGVLEFHASRRPEKVVLIEERRTRTNAELDARVNALAAALTARGIGRGDVVAILMCNRIEFIETIYAIGRIGAVFLPLNFRLAPEEWRYILGNSGAKALLSEAEFTDIAETVTSIDGLTHLIAVDGGGSGRWLDYEQLIGGHEGARTPIAPTALDDLQRIMYTSGTTSRPKGACISHGNVAFKNMALAVEFGWTDLEVTMVAGPLYHVGALDMGGLATLAVGGSLVLQRKFDPALLLANIQKHRPSSIWLAPAMVNALLQHSDFSRTDMTSLRLILSGGEKMPVSRLRTLLDAMPELTFADAYGLTETVSSDTFLDRVHMYDKIGSVGRPVLYQELRVVDERGADVGADQLGEIVLRGPKVFKGYWNDPDATARAIVDGWFHTGDVGRLDADGFLFIEDRKKDMIVSGGENIATPEVERVLYEHDDILEAAVIGRPHEKWGEVPHAFVVLREGATASQEDIVDFCISRIARFKAPRTVTFITALPRTPSGKVLKQDLRRQLAAEVAG